MAFFLRDKIALSRHRHLRWQKKNKKCVNNPIKCCVHFVMIRENKRETILIHFGTAFFFQRLILIL